MKPQHHIATLYYIHDPMCSWCWGFKPTLQALQQQLAQPAGQPVAFKSVLGGLAADTQDPMPATQQQQIQQTWRHIQGTIPGTEFNFAFWQQCQPRRSTYPACRAVIAAGLQAEQMAAAMTEAIQAAYYLHAKNPSDESVLIELAAELELDTKQFEHDLHAKATNKLLQQQIHFSRSIGTDSLPSLYLEYQGVVSPLVLDYLHADIILQHIHSLIPKP